MLRKFLLIETLTQHIHTSLREAVDSRTALPMEVEGPASDKPYSGVPDQVLSNFFPGKERLLKALFSKDTYKNNIKAGRLIDPDDSMNLARRRGIEVIEGAQLLSDKKEEYLDAIKKAKDFAEVINVIAGLVRFVDLQARALQKRDLSDFRGHDPELDEKLFDLSTYVDANGNPLDRNDLIHAIKNRVYRLANLSGIRYPGDELRRDKITHGEFSDIEEGDVLDKVAETAMKVPTMKYYEEEDPDTGDIIRRPVEKTVPAGTVIGNLVVTKIVRDNKSKQKIIVGKVKNSRDAEYSKEESRFTIEDLRKEGYVLDKNIKYGVSKSTSRTSSTQTISTFEFMGDSDATAFKKEIDALKSLNPDDYFKIVFKWADKQAQDAIKNVKSLPRSYFEKGKEELPQEYQNRIEKYKAQYDYAYQEYINQLINDLGEGGAKKYIDKLDRLYNKSLAEDGYPSPYIFNQIDSMIANPPSEVEEEDELASALLHVRETGGIIPKDFENVVFMTAVAEAKSKLAEQLDNVQAGTVGKETFMEAIDQLQQEKPTFREGLIENAGTFLWSIDDLLDILGENVQILTQGQVLEPILQSVKDALLGTTSKRGFIDRLILKDPTIGKSGAHVTKSGVVSYTSTGGFHEQYEGLKRKINAAATLSEITSILSASFLNEKIQIRGMSADEIKNSLLDRLMRSVSDLQSSELKQGNPNYELYLQHFSEILSQIKNMKSQRAWALKFDNYWTNVIHSRSNPLLSRKLRDKLDESILWNLRTHISNLFNTVKENKRSLFSPQDLRDELEDARTVSKFNLIATNYLSPEEGYRSEINDLFNSIYEFANKEIKEAIDKQLYSQKVRSKLLSLLREEAGRSATGYLAGLERFVRTHFPARAPEINNVIVKTKTAVVSKVRELLKQELQKIPTLRGTPQRNIMLTLSENVMHTLDGLGRFIRVLTGTAGTGLESILYTPGGVGGQKDALMDIILTSKMGRTVKDDLRQKLGFYHTIHDLSIEQEKLAMDSEKVGRLAQSIGLARSGMPLGFRKGR